MSRGKKHVKITLSMRCECGYDQDVTEFGPEMRVIPGYTNENGTSWPGEIELVCPACHGVDNSRTV